MCTLPQDRRSRKRTANLFLRSRVHHVPPQEVPCTCPPSTHLLFPYMGGTRHCFSLFSSFPTSLCHSHLPYSRFCEDSTFQTKVCSVDYRSEAVRELYLAASACNSHRRRKCCNLGGSYLAHRAPAAVAAAALAVPGAAALAAPAAAALAAPGAAATAAAPAAAPSRGTAPFPPPPGAAGAATATSTTLSPRTNTWRSCRWRCSCCRAQRVRSRPPLPAGAQVREPSKRQAGFTNLHQDIAYSMYAATYAVH